MNSTEIALLCFLYLTLGMLVAGVTKTVLRRPWHVATTSPVAITLLWPLVVVGFILGMIGSIFRR